MPIYVYGCQDCGAEEEHIQRFSDAPLTECSSCGGRLSKQITSAAFHLKGGGWYKDGYASSKSGDAGDASGSAASDSGSDSKGESSKGTKAESKSKGKDSAKKKSKASTKAAAAE